MIDFRCAFPGKIYELLEFAKIFYIGFRLRLVSSRVFARKGHQASIRSIFIGGRRWWHAGESASFHFQYRVDSPPSGSSSSWRKFRESRVYVTVRDVISDSPVAVSISMRIYLLKCNKLDRSEIYLSRCVARKDTLSRRSIHSLVAGNVHIILYTIIIHHREKVFNLIYTLKIISIFVVCYIYAKNYKHTRG